MNIKSIKTRANEVLAPYNQSFIRILWIVMLLNAIPSIINGNNSFSAILSLILTIVFLPVEHGIVVGSLKIVRNMGHTVDDQDGVVGLKRFSDLFSTYFARVVFVFVVSFIVIFILGIISAIIIGSQFYYFTSLTNPSLDVLLTSLLSSPTVFITILFIFIVLVLFELVLDAYLVFVPYLLEQYQIKGFKAIKTSFSMMKGHVLDYMKLFFSFFGWIVLSSLLEGLLSEVIGISVIVTLIISIFQIYTYIPLFHMSNAVFFEEIAFYYFNQEGEVYAHEEETI